MIRRLLPVSLSALILPLALILAAGAVPASPASASTSASSMPTREQWVSLVYRDLTGAVAYERARAAQGGGKLALNLDIDNTAMATYYAPGRATSAVLRIARDAKARGIYVLFNTGRNVSMRTSTLALLRNAGYPVDGLCMHYTGEGLAQSKQRCRQSFVNNGFTIIANIGNRATDFEGGNYERRYALPNFGNRLG